MPIEVKIFLCVLIYAFIFWSLLWISGKKEIQRQSRLRRCANHANKVKPGQLAIVDEHGCDVCLKK